MPHTFPPRRIRAGEPVDPDVFNETFQAVAGKLAGRLNEQDIDSATLKSNVVVAEDAYYAVHTIVKASDPDLANNASVWVAGTWGDDPVADIEDNPSWDQLTDVGGTDTLSVSFDSSDDTIVVFAQIQHFAWLYSNKSEAPDPGTTVRLQYAIEVDGTPIDMSATGAVFVPDPPPQQWYRASAAAGSSTYSDWRHILPLVNTVGINNAANSTRVIYSTQVESGSHTVSLVSRRVPRHDFKLDEGGTGVGVAAFNRRLFVLRIKGSAPYSGTSAPSLSIDAVEDGETVSLGSVFTNSLEAARTNLNDVQPTNMSRGALRNEHLPSIVYGADVAYIQPANAVPQTPGQYPGYGVDGPEWVTVNDGVGNNIEITGPAGGWRFDQNPGTFVVLANVQVWRIEYDDILAVNTEDVRACAVFTLAFTNHLGTRTLLESTEAVVNAHNPNPTTSTNEVHEPIGDDIPLMWVVDTTDLSADDQRITKVEVLVSQIDRGTGAGAPYNLQVRTQRGSIHSFALKNTFPS